MMWRRRKPRRVVVDSRWLIPDGDAWGFDVVFGHRTRPERATHALELLDDGTFRVVKL